MPTPQFLWCWNLSGLDILVPKQNGTGWLKVPAGHHRSERTRALEDAGNCDVFGLDGTLTFNCGSDIAVYRDKHAAYEAKVFPVVERLFKCVRGAEVSYDRIDQELKKQNGGTR